MGWSVMACITSGIVAGFAAAFWHPEGWLPHGTYPALLSLFSIFAGFLLTAIALVGNGLTMIMNANWRVLQHYQSRFIGRMFRFCLLLLLYIVICILILYVIAMNHVVPCWLVDMIIGFSCAALFYSLLLPFTLGGLYKEYYRAALLGQERQDRE